VSAETPDFGEPWVAPDYPAGEIDARDGFDRLGMSIAYDFLYGEGRARAVACVNALRGVPDPEAFVKTARRIRGALASARHALRVLAGRYEKEGWEGSIADYVQAEAEFDAADWIPPWRAARGKP